MLRNVFVRHASRPFNAFRGTSTVTECREPRPFTDIPAIPSIPIFGTGHNYIPFIGKYKFSEQHHAAEKKYQEYGHIIREYLNKRFNIVHVYRLQDIQKVLRNEGRYPNRTGFECINKYRKKRRDLYANSGVLQSNGKEWHEVRTQVQPHMLKPKAIHTFLSGMDDISRDQVNRTALLRQENGEVKDYLNELYKWALESVGLVALDARLGCLDLNPKEDGMNMIRIVNDLFQQINTIEFSPLSFLQRINVPLLRKFTKNMDDFSETVQKYLSLAMKRLKDLPEDHDPTFLEMLISTTNDPRDIFTTLTDMFFAGIDTTSTTVALTLYHLARNPEAQKKAHQEAVRILRDEGMTVQTLNNAKYIKACIKESMRLSPIIPGNVRILPEDIVLSGYHVPAGKFIVMNSYVAGRLAENFQDPLAFRPERFLREQIAHDPFAFLPFGFGTRSCLGRRIAEQEMWTLLIRLVERFRVEYHHGEMDLVSRVLLTPNRPLDLQFHER